MIFLAAIPTAFVVAAVVWLVLPRHGEHAEPPRHAAEREKASLDRLRGVVPHKTVDGHPPWPVLPAGALEPLPEPPMLNTFTGTRATDDGPPTLLPDEGADDLEALVNVVKEWFGPRKPAALDPQTTGEIGERVELGCGHCGDFGHATAGHDAVMSILSPPRIRPSATPPGELADWVIEGLKNHCSTDAALESIVAGVKQRSQP